MHRHVISLRDHVAAVVENRARVVTAFLDVWRKSCPFQRRTHFFCNRVKQTFEDSQLYRINHCSSTKFKYASTVHRKPGGTSVVELYSPMMAGPLMTCPWPNVARS